MPPPGPAELARQEAILQIRDAAARRDGVTLLVTSAYCSEAEQARLFAERPDPHWVAPLGRSLHWYGTELDLGPPSDGVRAPQTMTLIDALSLLIAEQANVLAVTDDGGRVLGSVTKDDLLR